MKTYKVIGVKIPKEQESDEQKFGPIKDSNGYYWDPNSQVTDSQVADELAAQLMSESSLELLSDDSK